jgi:hypothetical protein
MTSMQWNKVCHEKARELAAKIAAEKDHDTFTALVEELNRLLEGDTTSQTADSQQLS